MRVSVVSDVHGNLDDLARVAECAEFLIVLGDLLEYVDYHDPSAGILGTIFGAEAVRKFACLRAAAEFDEMQAYEFALWGSLVDSSATLHDVVSREYSRVMSVLGPNTLVTLGNVDVPSIWESLAPEHLRCRDGEVVELDGLRLGFVSGGALKRPVPGSPWRYNERTPDDYRSSLARLDRVDILCSHVPPDIEDLRYDTRVNRKEMYGPGLLEAIDEYGPALALSGHVHHPRSRSAGRGHTRCVNVGFFKRHPTPFVFDTEAHSSVDRRG